MSRCCEMRGIEAGLSATVNEEQAAIGGSSSNPSNERSRLATRVSWPSS
jgi:hypothetical protein